LWCEDEARLGLKPITRRVRAPEGSRPTSNGRHKFESVFVYGFAHPRTGRGRFLILPEANSDLMGHALADFAGWADPDGRKVLVLDRAGGHTAKRLEVPPNVVLHHQPSCTPELQPAEHLWPLVREGLANRVFDTLPKLAARCQWLTEHTDVIAGAVGSLGPRRLTDTDQPDLVSFRPSASELLHSRHFRCCTETGTLLK
jgi:hypothetical protein